jgi:hypothetical protein
MYMPNVNLPLHEKMLKEIDEHRGDIPRTVWLRYAIERRLKDVAPTPSIDPDAPVLKPSSAKKRAAEMRKGADPFEPIMSEELAHAKNPLKPLMPKKCGHDSKYKTVSGNCIICEREG